MQTLLAPLALTLVSPLCAQTLLAVEENPPGVRVIDVTAGGLIGERLIDLTTVQPPLANQTVHNAIGVGPEIWVTAGDRIYRFDAAGSQLGSTGPFSPIPQGMDFVGGSVWVAGATVLLQLAPDGTLIATHPALYAHNVLGFHGRLLVSNQTQHTIDLYGLDGQFLSVFSDTPPTTASYFSPGQLALDPVSGNILVESAVKLFELDTTGAFVGEYEAGAFERAAAPLDDGRLLVTLYESTVIFDRLSGESLTVPGSDQYALRALSIGGPGSGAFQRYCSANANSTGQAGQVGAFGAASVSADTFALQANRVPPAESGFFLYGPNVAQLSWGDGVLCTGPSGINRILPGVVTSVAGIAAKDVSFAALPPAGAILPGSTWSLQFVFRDPAGGPAGFNATDAVRLTFEP